MLLRSILEKALRSYVEKSGNFQKVKDYYYKFGEGKKKNHSAEFMAAQGLDLSMMLADYCSSSCG